MSPRIPTPTVDPSHNRIRVQYGRSSKYFGPRLGQDPDTDAQSWAQAFAFVAAIAAKKHERKIVDQIPVSTNLRPNSAASTWSVVWKSYLDYAREVYMKRGAQTSQYSRCKRVCELFLSDPSRHELLLAAMPGDPSTFGPKSLMKLRDELACNVAPARRTLVDWIGVVVHVAKWAESREMADPGYSDWLRTIPPLLAGRKTSACAPVLAESRKKNPPDPAALRATLEHCQPMIAAMASIQGLCGMRAEEVCGMRVDAIRKIGKREAWIYTVPASHNKLSHKEKERNPLWGPAGNTIINPWIDLAKLHGSAFVFSPRVAETLRNQAKRIDEAARASLGYQHPAARRQRRLKRDGLRTRAPRECYTTDSYNRAVSRAFKSTGLPDSLHWSVGQLRHEGISRIANEAKDIYLASEIAGHADIRTTLKYASIDESRIAQYAEQNL